VQLIVEYDPLLAKVALLPSGKSALCLVYFPAFITTSAYDSSLNRTFDTIKQANPTLKFGSIAFEPLF
jgi:hypothetical protein